MLLKLLLRAKTMVREEDCVPEAKPADLQVQRSKADAYHDSSLWVGGLGLADPERERGLAAGPALLHLRPLQPCSHECGLSTLQTRPDRLESPCN